ncbi:uncharacterized protein PGTG_04839 [Puccinia graminis f. sp. tritici CRL 75-36-700-3]|uniref:Uncharacterized protein n=1 Tax=Puccinia graminis f. sp. tritici (strain CRL 75-36-700-3 / race SCCL) TaxID=418459 RepID=E3K326_PUCGT|nr:uncharacterized protein PGTG_04839 [Puccinia graminis f. sp. tritici CRL 75-36-700-3]EFP78883.1 hypothetical protein PGTG_04839 [Puccinia graminis f. sp. tritici CRL 75-36-700-3]
MKGWMDSAIHQQLDDTFASIGVENQAYQGDQLAYDPELDALYAYEQQAFYQRFATPSQLPEFRSDASGSQALVEDFAPPTHIQQFPEYYSDPIGIQGIGQYPVVAAYGDYQVDQAGPVEPAPVAPQAPTPPSSQDTQLDSSDSSDSQSDSSDSQSDSSDSPPPHPRVALLRLDGDAPRRIRLGTPPRPREGAQGALKKQAEEGVQGVLGNRKRSADEDPDDQSRPTSRSRLA